MKIRDKDNIWRQIKSLKKSKKMVSGALSFSGFNFRKSNIVTKNYVNTRNNILHDTRTRPMPQELLYQTLFTQS